MADKVKWYEFWGVEPRKTPPPEMLYKIPGELITDSEAELTVQSMVKQGCTEVELRKVYEND